MRLTRRSTRCTRILSRISPATPACKRDSPDIDSRGAKIAREMFTESNGLVATLRKELTALKHALEDERKGRINAERTLRQLSQAQAKRDGYALKSIGIVHSCFPDRRGTPRQPTLCPVVWNLRMHAGCLVIFRQ